MSRTFEEAQDHVAGLRELDQLAHAIAIFMIDQPQSPKVRELVQKYKKLRERVEAFGT
jgi:hypothetical protein